jgi:Tfp pilus assembly protein PilO
MNLNLKTREKIMLAAVVAIVFYFLTDFLLLRPLGKEIQARQARLKEIEEKMASTVNTLPELNSLKSRVEEKRRFLNAAKDKVVGQEQVRVFLDQLASESSRLKLEILALSFGQENEMSGGKSGKAGTAPEKNDDSGKPLKFKKVSANVNLTGAYENVREYLYQVERLPLFMELDQIQIQGNKDGLPKVQLTFRPGFFMKNDEKL